MSGLDTSLAIIMASKFTLQEFYAITIVYICVASVLLHSMTLSLYSKFHYVYSGRGKKSLLFRKPQFAWDKRHLHGLNS